MQAITLAIGKNGITFFAQHYLADALSALLGKMTPPDKSVPVPNFTGGVVGDSYDYSNIKIKLTGGSLRNFSAALNKVVQGVGNDGKTPVFNVNMQALNFQAQYNWEESFHYMHNYTTVPYGSKIPVWHHDPGDSSNRFSYSPGFGQLDVAIVIEFSFDKDKKLWEFTVQKASPNASNVSANIPGGSILQDQDFSCTKNHVDDATAQAIDAIDFATPVNQLLTGIVQTIPGSGNLGNGIVYDFSMGDSGMLFPNNDGIQIGIKGGASFNGTPFSGPTPPSLPLPAPPADNDAHHLYLYVSNFELEALHWAFYKAGKLNTVVNPTDLPDPAALKVATYVALEKSLAPYKSFAMQAHINQNAAPVTVSQTVWELTQNVMNTLQSQLPQNVFTLLGGLQGNAYAVLANLESDLQSATIPQQYFATIESAAKRMGLVVTQSMDFDLIIQNGSPTPPDIKFSLQRTDVLTTLKLGINNNKNQTLQYDFLSTGYQATFISSSIPGFKGDIFGTIIWPVGGEPQYDKVLADMGATGAPIPIMSGFQFDFANAQLSLQEGYVSILANVIYQ